MKEVSLARRRKIRLDLRRDHDRSHRHQLPHDIKTVVGITKWVVFSVLV